MRLSWSLTRGRSPWFPCVVVVATVVSVLISGCGGDDDDDVAGPESTVTVSSGDGTVAAGSAIASGSSTAVVEIGELRYDFDVICYEAGAGELIAAGMGITADGAAVELLVEASVSQPYIGLHVQPGGPIIESALDQPLNLVVQDDHIRGGAIFFIQNVDLATGVGTDAGVGDVDVTCTSYERGAPAGY